MISETALLAYLKSPISQTDLDRRIAELSLYEFVRQAWSLIEPAPFVDGWHIQAVCDHLQAVTNKQLEKLLVNIPPGTGKSLLTSVFWPAWEWAVDPSIRWFFASYDQRLSTRDSVRCRALIGSPWYQRFWGQRFKLTGDQNLKIYYETDGRGYRLATSIGGHGTGEHPNRIVCLPHYTPIMTECGVMSIGEIVAGRLGVRVLSFDHSRSRNEWQDIEAFECSPGRAICRVRLADGGVLDATEDHPVYVFGKGYIPAGNLCPGDEVIRAVSVQGLRQGVSAEAESQGPVLQSYLLQREQATGEYGFLQGVWESCLPGSDASRKIDNSGRLLFPPMPRLVHSRRPAPPLSWNDGQVLCGLRCRVLGGKAAVHKIRRVRSGMSGGLAADKQPATAKCLGGMRLLRHGHQDYQVSPGANQLLLAELCEQGPCRANARNRQPELHSRHDAGGVFQNIHQAAKSGQESGGALLFFVQQNRGGESPGAGHPSHRRRQDQRLPGEPRWTLQSLPREAQRDECSAATISSATVSSVERTARIPDKVYNIRVAKNHNYFADGVLVHNCDDPHSVMQAESPKERQSTLDWWDLTMSTRGVSIGASRVIIMQRLHENDLAGRVLAEGGWTHLCLPMRYEPGRTGPTPLGWSDPRTEDGELLCPKQFDEVKVKGMEAKLGSYGTAGQLQQRPTPRVGGMFKRSWFKPVGAAPVKADRIRAWDKAATEGGGDWTVGLLMAKSSEGLYFIEDVVRGQWSSRQRNEKMKETADRDKERFGDVKIWVEEEGGSSGKESSEFSARLLAGYPIKADRPTGSKEVRAEAFADQAEAGNVFIVAERSDSRWHSVYLDELSSFPHGKHDDQVDASSLAFNKLALTIKRELKVWT